MPENPEPENPQPDQPQTDEPEAPHPQTVGSQPEASDAPEGTATTGDRGQRPDHPDTEKPSGTDTQHAASPDDPTTEVTTTYERTTQGHRVTRRTVHRREVNEDTHETIEETYPVPTPYAPPAPDHPTPVG